MSSTKSKLDATHEWADPDTGELEPEGRGRFRPASRSACHDWWWILLWLAQLGAVLGLGLSYYAEYADDMGSPTHAALRSTRTAPAFDAGSMQVVGATMAAGFGLSLCFLLLVHKFPRQMIYISLALVAVLIAAVAVISLAQRRWGGGMLSLLMLPLWIWWCFAVRDRIAFAATLLETVMTALSNWPSLLWVTLGGMVLQCAWFVLWLIVAVSIFFHMQIEFDHGKPASSSNQQPNKSVLNAKMFFALFGLLLSFFWTSQILKNLVHMTASGVMGTWYFLFPMQLSATAWPVWDALRRACTTSFGSVIFGSFLTAFVKALRTAVHLLRSWAHGSEASCITMAVLCIVECLLAQIEALVEYFNMYAFTYMAIYGRPYLQSAKLAMDMMKSRGLDAVINDDLIGPVLFVGMVFVGAFCATVAPLTSEYIFHASGAWQVWVVLGLVLGLCVSSAVVSLVESGVVTLFVCLADDPTHLRHTKPEIAHKIFGTLEERGANLQGGAEGHPHPSEV